MRDPHARLAFTFSRAALRAILGRYLGVSPADIAIATTATGKPVVPGERIRFSVAHAGDLTLIAVAREVDVGIDAERVRDGVSIGRIAQRFFARHEVRSLDELPGAARREAFFVLWTCKEAYLKATGTGLAGLEHVEVTLPHRPGRPPTLATPLQPASRWTLRTLVPSPDHVAALAVADGEPRVRYWDWRP